MLGRVFLLIRATPFGRRPQIWPGRPTAGVWQAACPRGDRGGGRRGGRRLGHGPGAPDAGQPTDDRHLGGGRPARAARGRVSSRCRRWPPVGEARVAAALDGREAVASHVTALALWELLEHPPGPVHASVDPTRSAAGSRGVVAAPVSRSVRRAAPRRQPLRDVRRALDRRHVGAAGASAPRRRAGRGHHRRPTPALHAAGPGVRTRTPSAAGRAEPNSRGCVDLLADGCQSELEIWGCLQVLRGPGMPRLRAAAPSRRRPARPSFLDAAYDEVLLAVEMDGAAWHGSRQQRERDIRRDALLATIGWQTLRFSYARMTASPEGCRTRDPDGARRSAPPVPPRTV